LPAHFTDQFVKLGYICQQLLLRHS
jgi:hypothetical protein